MGGERLARFIAGECSDEERGQVQAWIDADPARAELASLSGVWELTGRGDAAWEVDRAWQEFVTRRSSRPAARSATREPMRVAAPRVAPRRTAAMWALRAAAVLAVLIGGAVLWNQFRGPSQATESIALREFTTGPAEQIEVSLTDGTRVLLAPRSSRSSS